MKAEWNFHFILYIPYFLQRSGSCWLLMLLWSKTIEWGYSEDNEWKRVSKPYFFVRIDLAKKIGVTSSTRHSTSFAFYIYILSFSFFIYFLLFFFFCFITHYGFLTLSINKIKKLTNFSGKNKMKNGLCMMFTCHYNFI